MKIVCGSCQAKYSIADEKVAGKVFKIRCKRCSEVIVVRGDQEQENEAAPEAGNGSYGTGTNGSHAAAAGYETSVDAIWHVVVNGEQAGPYAPNQLADMLRAGQLDWEAYVWCEGFENWLPMRDVPDLVAAISGQPVAAPAAAPAAQAAAQPSMGADPFADEASAAAGAMFAQPAAQSAARSNLFGGGGDVASVPFDTSPKMIPSAAPSPRVTADQAMTGARNENSVLFSLKNLQALATGGSVAPGPSTSHRPGYAGGEGSGLIDIRALASATGVADQAKDESEKDALLSLGSAQAGAFGALGSPMLAPGKVDDDSGKKGLALAIMGGFALLAGAAVAIAFILKPGSTPTSGVVAPVAPPPPAAVAPATGTMTATNNDPKTAERPSEGELAARRAAEKAAPAASSTSAEHDRGRSGSTKHSGDKAAAEKPAAEPPKAASDPLLATKPAEKKAKGGSSSLDDLLEGAIGSKGGASSAPKAAAADANLPEKPSRDDVMDAMNGLKDQVKTCAKGQGGVAFANVTVVGKTGRVSNVEVTGITGEVGSCIARAVRGAKFAKFKAENFQVKYPFRL